MVALRRFRTSVCQNKKLASGTRGDVGSVCGISRLVSPHLHQVKTEIKKIREEEVSTPVTTATTVIRENPRNEALPLYCFPTALRFACQWPFRSNVERWTLNLHLFTTSPFTSLLPCFQVPYSNFSVFIQHRFLCNLLLWTFRNIAPPTLDYYCTGVPFWGLRFSCFVSPENQGKGLHEGVFSRCFNACRLGWVQCC